MNEAGWTIGESIAMELDAALSIAGGYLWPGELRTESLGWLHALPADWQEQWPEFLGGLGGFVSLLETLAYLAGVILENDYSRATLAMREISAETAASRIGDVPGADRGVDLAARIAAVKETAYAAVGLVWREEQTRFLRREADRAVRVLRGGDLHARFWHWLDRFYYQFYHPWRLSRRDLMDAAQKKARAALGQGGLDASPPPIEWLPRINPLLRYPELSRAVQENRLPVVFWAEPFGLPDAWTIWPDMLVVSFAEAGELCENFRAFAADVAARINALADPTRLVILRMIRHFGLINTEIAASLGLARPTVSAHAKILRQAGLIRSRREERVVRHEILPGEVRRLFRDLARFLDLPDEPDDQG